MRGRLRRSRWHVQQISELATAAASETSMKMLNNVDGKRKLKNENENEHLENGSNKVLDSISGNVLYSVHWANGFCYSINICQEPKGVACYLPKPSTPCQHHLPHHHTPHSGVPTICCDHMDVSSVLFVANGGVLLPCPLPSTTHKQTHSHTHTRKTKATRQNTAKAKVV